MLTTQTVSHRGRAGAVRRRTDLGQDCAAPRRPADRGPPITAMWQASQGQKERLALNSLSLPQRVEVEMQWNRRTGRERAGHHW
jgi:hypothetical protein